MIGCIFPKRHRPADGSGRNSYETAGRPSWDTRGDMFRTRKLSRGDAAEIPISQVQQLRCLLRKKTPGVRMCTIYKMNRGGLRYV
ncbi:hypothetical protein D3Z53_20560 [Lachnospiraceae bacterium]|nr:hypothetical protein [Lachnospiraceae bacterium]